MELENLTNVMIDLMKREQNKFAIIKRDRISIKEKLKDLKRSLKVGTQTDFAKLIDIEKGIDDIVITFISLLELARLHKISIFQE